MASAALAKQKPDSEASRQISKSDIRHEALNRTFFFAALCHFSAKFKF